MNAQRMIGVVILVVGVVFMCVGFNASNSVADQMKHTFTGNYTDQTAWYIFGGLAASVASGDLPNNVTVLKDGSAGDTDEGRAILEEIHDLAPNASLYFYSGDGDENTMVTAVNALKNAGCKVIVDDISY